MGIYALHKLLFDLRRNTTVKEAFLADPEAVYSRYALNTDELAALRSKDLYRLHKWGVSAYLLASFAQFLGFPLREFSNILRAGARAEQQRRPT